jgi:hypothetical protein
MWITSVQEQGAPLRQSISLGIVCFERPNQRTTTGRGPDPLLFAFPDPSFNFKILKL